MLEAHRVEKRLPKGEVAKRAGYTRRIYGDWCRGDITNPSLNAVMDYLAVLGLQLSIGPRP